MKRRTPTGRSNGNGKYSFKNNAKNEPLHAGGTACFEAVGRTLFSVHLTALSEHAAVLVQSFFSQEDSLILHTAA